MTAPAPVCAHNRFPTVVVGPDGTRLPEARTVIVCPDLDRKARLLVWSRPGAPAIDAAIDLDRSTIGRPRDPWFLVTEAGSYQVQPGRGCACGNRLKRWTPPELEPLRMGVLPS